MTWTQFWIFLVVFFGFCIYAAIAGATPLQAQEIEIAPGDTVTVISPVPEPVVPETVLVSECPAGWTCEPPAPEPEPDPVPPDTTVATPPTPTNVSLYGYAAPNMLNPTSNGLVLTWDADEADSFRVYGGLDSGSEGDWQVILPGNVREYRRQLFYAEVTPLWGCVRTIINNWESMPQCDGFNWPPMVQPSPYIISVTQDSTAITGNLEVTAGSWSIHLDRVDGAWAGLDREILPSVDSVVMCSGGVCNREQRLPYELGGGRIDLPVGVYDITWELFGDEPGSGSETITVN